MKFLAAVLASAFALSSVCNAAPVTIGSVTFDDEDGADEVYIAAGGHYNGPPSGWRFIGDRVPEAEGFDLNDYWEVNSNPHPHADDVLEAKWIGKTLMNGPGFDLLIFEVLNQNDAPVISLILGGVEIFGTALETFNFVRSNGSLRSITIYGFDLSDFGLALGETVDSIFVNRNIGTPDIAAIVGVNFLQQDPTPEIPLPAAAPLFLAGLAWFGFLRRRRKAV